MFFKVLKSLGIFIFVLLLKQKAKIHAVSIKSLFQVSLRTKRIFMIVNRFEVLK